MSELWFPGVESGEVNGFARQLALEVDVKLDLASFCERIVADNEIKGEREFVVGEGGVTAILDNNTDYFVWRTGEVTERIPSQDVLRATRFQSQQEAQREGQSINATTARPRVDVPAIAYLLALVAAEAWAISQWNSDATFASVFRLVAAPVAVTILFDIAKVKVSRVVGLFKR